MHDLGPYQLPLTTVAFLVVYSLGCAGALRYPLIGVITYLLVYFTYPAMTWWAKPIAWMGIRYAYGAGIFTAIGLVLNWTRLRSRGKLWHHQETLMLALFATMWISMLTGSDPCETSYKQIDKMTKVRLPTMTGSTISWRTLHRRIGRFVTGFRCAVTSSGRSWTISNGPTATRSGSASFTWTSRPSNAS